MKRISLAALAVLVSGSACAVGVPGQGDWQTTLLPRDLNGDGVADAFYDTTLNITWLRDANLAGGPMFWQQANDWANNLVYGGHSDWRLPYMVDTGTPGCHFGYFGTDCGYNIRTTFNGKTLSELGHLFNVTLGNIGYCDTSGTCNQPGWGLSNTGDFVNLVNNFYWTSVSYEPKPDLAWYFYAYTEYQSFGYQNHLFYALAVRDGDTGSALLVPEPGTAASLAAGLVLLAALRRRYGKHM